MREPAVGRSIQLPEFANAVTLPAPHRRAHFFGRNRMGQPVGQGPAADLGAVELEVMQAQGFRRDKTVRARRGATEPFAEEVQHGLRPGRGMIAARVAGPPERSGGLGAGGEISGGQDVKPAAGDPQLAYGLGGRQGALIKVFKHVADKRGCQPMAELLIVFRAGENTRRPGRCRQSFRRPSLRSASSKTGGSGSSCPALLTTQLVLLCSPRDSQKYRPPHARPMGDGNNLAMDGMSN